MKTLALSFALVLVAALGFAQQATTSFSSNKIGIIDNGIQSETSEGQATVITVDYNNLMVSFETSSLAVGEQLGNNYSKRIEAQLSKTGNTTSMLLEDGFVLTIYDRQRMVVLSHQDMNPRQFAVKFLETTVIN